MTVQLSEKGIENLKRIEQCRNQQSKYIKLQSAEKMVLHFDAERIEQVTDPNDPNQTERYITFSKRFSEQIDTLLREGHTIIKVPLFTYHVLCGMI